MKTSLISAAFAQHSPEFDGQPFGTVLQPAIRESVSASGLDQKQGYLSAGLPGKEMA